MLESFTAKKHLYQTGKYLYQTKGSVRPKQSCRLTNVRLFSVVKVPRIKAINKLDNNTLNYYHFLMLN